MIRKGEATLLPQAHFPQPFLTFLLPFPHAELAAGLVQSYQPMLTTYCDSSFKKKSTGPCLLFWLQSQASNTKKSVLKTSSPNPSHLEQPPHPLLSRQHGLIPTTRQGTSVLLLVPVNHNLSGTELKHKKARAYIIGISMIPKLCVTLCDHQLEFPG